MKRIIYAVMLLLGLSILSSCDKENGGNAGKGELTGTWTLKGAKMAVGCDPNVQAFVDDLCYLVFSGNNVKFEGEGGNTIGSGTYSYKADSKESVFTTGTISFTGVPIVGGQFERETTQYADMMSWDDVDGISISIVSGRITF